MRLIAVLTLLCVFGAPRALAQESDFDPQARVTEALERVRPIAYHRSELDWAAIETRARTLATGARDEVDLMPAYQAVVSYLNDNHSFVRYPDGLMERWRERYGDRRMLPDPPPSGPRPTSTFMGRSESEVRLLDLGSQRAVAVVVVPSVAQAEAMPSPFGTRLHEAVRQVHPQVCGYMVDLRGNTGGDMFPMVVGLSDLVGDGHGIVFVKPDGAGMSATLRGGSVFGRLDDGSEVLLDRIDDWRPAAGVETRPVAVLLDDATASSGEGLALALIGRPDVRTFGSRTAGRASANEMIQISDGTRLFITTAMMTDRLGRTYPDGIPPDETASMTESGDGVVEAAKAWLATQHACAPAAP